MDPCREQFGVSVSDCFKDNATRFEHGPLYYRKPVKFLHQWLRVTVPGLLEDDSGCLILDQLKFIGLINGKT